MTATYAADGAATGLHLTTVTQTGLQLSWTAPAGSAFSLRRSTGSAAPQQRSDGTAVPVNGTSATDQGLTAGTQYSYSLFTRIHARWYGPLIVTASTSPAPGSTDASYVAEPSTLIAKASDIVSAVTTGTGVRVVLADQVAPRLLGSAVILPISGTLPGGYLGVVNAVSSDGRTVDLAAGGLSDAFDYYELSVDSFTTDPNLLTAARSGAATADAPQPAVLTSVTKPLSPAAGAAPAAAVPAMAAPGTKSPTRRAWPWVVISRPSWTSTASWVPRCRPVHPWTWR